MPSTLPWSSGSTSPIAFAAPVDVGTRLIAAARARRRSLCGASCRFWSCVYAWIVVMKPGLDLAEVVQHLRERRDAVGRARRVRDDVVRVRVVLVVVDAEHDRDVRVRGRGGDDDLLRACIEMLLRTVAVGEEAGRLEHDVDAQVAPGQRAGIPLGEHAHLLAGGAERPVGELDLALERAERRVVLQEVGHRLRVAEVVQRDDLEIGPERVPRAEEVPPDAAESVDADASSHPLLRFSVPVPARASLFGELFEPSQASMDGDPRERRVGTRRELAERLVRVTEPKLRHLA